MSEMTIWRNGLLRWLDSAGRESQQLAGPSPADTIQGSSAAIERLGSWLERLQQQGAALKPALESMNAVGKRGATEATMAAAGQPLLRLLVALRELQAEIEGAELPEDFKTCSALLSGAVEHLRRQVGDWADGLRRQILQTPSDQGWMIESRLDLQPPPQLPLLNAEIRELEEQRGDRVLGDDIAKKLDSLIALGAAWALWSAFTS